MRMKTARKENIFCTDLKEKIKMLHFLIPVLSAITKKRKEKTSSSPFLTKS